MARKESTQLRHDLATGAVTVTAQAVNAPAWADKLLVKFKATTGTGVTCDFKFHEDNPDGSGTDIDIQAMDQIPQSQTNAQRYVGVGFNDAVSGTSYDLIDYPLTSTLKYTMTISGAPTNVKVWFCFIGDK
jgi:hypothetical protein